MGSFLRMLMKRCLLARVSRCQYLLNQENWLEKVETTIGIAACTKVATARSDMRLGTNWIEEEEEDEESEGSDDEEDEEEAKAGSMRGIWELFL